MSLPLLTYCPASVINDDAEFLEVLFLYRGKPSEWVPPAVSEEVADREVFVAALGTLLRRAGEPGSGVGYLHEPPVPSHLGERFAATTVQWGEVQAFDEAVRSGSGAEKEDLAALVHEAEDLLGRLKPPLFGIGA